MNQPRVRATATALVALGFAATSALPAAAAFPEPEQPAFNRVSTIPAYENTDVGQESVAEISSVTKDGNTVVYTDAESKVLGFVDISDPANTTADGVLELPGEPTSVYVADTPQGEYILAVVNTSESFTDPSGVVMVFDAATREQVGQIDLGGQPDSIDVNADGTQAVIAIENERDEEFTPEGGEEGDLPQMPAGHVVLIDLTAPVADWTPETVDVSGLEGLDTPEDPEPEYVKYSPNGEKIAVTLQENNGIVIIDAASGTVENHFSAGEVTVDGVDTADDGRIDMSGSITAVREPDAIGWVDDTHVATANEGDWKGGSRGWSIFDATTGEVTWDAGNTFEKLAVSIGHYPDGRSEKKGTEPEGLAVGTYNGVPMAFVASERGNFVAVYDVSDPGEPVFKQVLPSTMGPEGLLPIPERNLLVVSSEEDSADDGVRATLQTYELGDAPASYPEIASDLDDPIAWNALGSLTADPQEPTRLWTSSDNALGPSRILEIDNSGAPAQIVAQTPITLDGSEVTFDIEGIWKDPAGGFWLAVEGATGAENQIVQVNDDGEVLHTWPLPSDVAEKMDKFGIEGITGQADGSIWFTLQRELEGEDIIRIGRLDPESGDMGWFGYTPEAPEGDGWVGLSEIVAVDEDTFAVIERDNQAGDLAAIKRVYYVQATGEPGTSDAPIPLTKELAIDVLPMLGDTNGWEQEKLEGLAIDADRNLWAITDNDAVDDNSGETRFMNLGNADELNPFPADEPTAEPSDEPTAEPSDEPTAEPSDEPTAEPSDEPSEPETSAAPTSDAPAPAPEQGEGRGGRLPSTGSVLGLGAILGGLAAVAAGVTILRRR